MFISNIVYSQSNDTEKLIYLVTKNQSTPQGFKSKKEITTHLQNLIEQEREKGFLNTYFENLEKLNDSTYITSIVKNEQVQFLNIRNIDSLPEIIKEDFLWKGKINEVTIPIAEISSKLNYLNSKLSKAGYPFNKLKLKNIIEQNDSIYANLHVTGLQKRRLDSIVVKAYPKFPKSFIKYYAGVKKGNTYDNENIVNQAELLNSLPFTSNIKPAEVLFNPKNTVLYLYLKKENANNFDGFIGFSTDEDTGNLTLDGYLDLNLINNFNFGEELRITYKSDSESQQQFSATTKLPYLFKLPLGIEASLSIFTQDDEFSTTEQNIGINYTLNPRISFFTGYKKYESADLNEDENIVSLNTNFESQFLQSEVRYVHKQNKLLFPQKTSIVLNAEIGERSNENVNQYKIGANIKHIFQLNNRNSIYIANNTQYFISSNFLNNELYRLGGILSIRGFEENSLRATAFNVLNTEYRYQLSSSIYAHSIIDFGFTQNEFTNTRDRLTSFGIGFGMLSKAGLFKLNYANGRSNSIPFEFGNSKIHLSLTAYF